MLCIMEPIKVWLAKAEEDFGNAVFNQSHGKLSVVAFLYQQAVEKALKAVLIAQGKSFPKIHDCFKLATLCHSPERVIQLSDFLTPYYFRTRYPDLEPAALTKKDIQNLKEAVEEILVWTKKQC